MIRSSKLIWALAAPLLCLTLGLFWYWQRVSVPPNLTREHSQEFLSVLSEFETVEGDLETQLHPERILSVATREYYVLYRNTSTPLTCPRCDQFWVTTRAEVSDVCVLEYSLTRSIVRATVRRWGNRVNAQTFESVQPGTLIELKDRSTYHLVRENGVWKITKVTDFAVFDSGSADPLGLEVYFQELGCH